MEQDRALPDRIVAAASEGRLLQLISEFLDDTERSKTIREKLVVLHNAEQIDLIGEFSALTTNNSPDFWLSRQIFESALPHLQAPILPTMHCCASLARQGNGDAFAGSILNAFVDFLAARPGRAEQALREIESNPELNVFLVATLVAQSRNDFFHAIAESLRLAKSASPQIRSNALYAIGRLDRPPETPIPDSVSDALEQLAAEETSDEILASALKTLAQLTIAAEEQSPEFIRTMKKLSERGGEHVVHAAAESLFASEKALPPESRQVLLEIVTRVDPKNRGTLNLLDIALNQLASLDRSAVEAFLEEVLVRNSGKLSLEDSFVHTANSIRRDMKWVGTLLTRWFLNGAAPLCEAIQELVSGYGGAEPRLEIDPKEVDVTDADKVHFVAAKVVGYLFIHVIPAVSILISLMEAASENGATQVGELLYDALLMNYASTRKEVDNAIASRSAPTTTILQGLRDRLERYFEDLPSDIVLPALVPSEEHREIQRRRRQQMMRDGMKQAEQRSVLRSIFQTSTLLYGRSSINYIYENAEKRDRVAMPLQRHGVEIEVPRLSIFDPFGLDYMLRTFRAQQWKR